MTTHASLVAAISLKEGAPIAALKRARGEAARRQERVSSVVQLVDDKVLALAGPGVIGVGT